jgi:Protein of unknown function (DUF2726)
LNTAYLITIGIAFVSLLVLVGLMKKISGTDNERDEKNRSNAYEFKRKIPLTEPEQKLYWRLIECEHEIVVLAQVNMYQVMTPRKSSRGAFNAISQKSIDFVICNKSFEVMCVIELDDSTHSKDKDMSRDAYLTTAGIKTLRYEAKNLPSTAELWRDIERMGANT